MDNLPPQINHLETNSTRPTAITVVCVLGFIGALLTIPAILLSLKLPVAIWYPPFLALSAIIGLVCMFGLWQMKRWAVFAYTAFVILNQIVLMTTGDWNIFALIIPGIVIAIGFKYLPRMR